ncbi:MAG TPA: hypothetical protein VFM18_02665 [Methanosarcina sp.]|nr:hypothetical protein [Methanosarcina sp.]
MNLYELTLKAANDLSIYKNPDISEWIAAINPILIAMGHNEITEYDTVTEIDVYSSFVSIRVEGIGKLYGNADFFEIPLSVLKAANPIKEAKIDSVCIGIQKTKKKIQEIEKDMAFYQNLLVTQQTKLQELLK